MVRPVVLLAALLVACATSEPTAPIDAPPDVAEPDAPDGAIDAPDAPTDAPVDAIDAIALDACVPAAETCNLRDDDCDQQIDEDFFTVGMPCSAGVGECTRMGTFACNATGAGVECSAMAGMPAAETCNTLDDDCDTRTDENLGLGVACDGPDTDLCTEGTTVCAAGGGVTCSDTTGNRVESCNALDDDCDTRTDEGFSLGMACDGGDTDACAEGALVCNAAGGTSCSDATGNTTELCNGVDDDCLGGVDNGYPVGAPCTAGVGACARPGTNMCNAAGTGVQCSATPGPAMPETCGNGVDEDCTGADVVCPTNDQPGGALNISGGGTFTIDLTSARNDQDFTGTSCGLTGGRDVFYTFTLPSAEVVYLDTFGSNFDTVLRVFAGSCAALGAHQACHDDACAVLQSQGGMSLAAGTYCVVADQYSSAQTLGSLILTFTRGGRTATAIAAASGSQAGTSCSGVNATTAGCQPNSTAQDVAYYFTVCPATTRTVTASTCNAASYDSVVYLRRAPATSSDLGCDDDACTTPELASSMPATAASGPGLFFLTVDGYQAQCGTYTLSYTIN